MKTLFLLISLYLAANAQDKCEGTCMDYHAPFKVGTATTDATPVGDTQALQKELDAVKRQLADATKLLEAYAKKYQQCDIALTQLQVLGDGKPMGVNNGDPKK